MGRALPASIALLVIFAVATGSSSGQPAARLAAANSFQLTATNVTPADRVGETIHVRLRGAIVANSKKAGPRRCRAERQITIFNRTVEPPGVIRREDLQPTTRSGKFDGVVFPYDYGGIDTDGEPRSGDVPFSGGTLVLEVVTKKVKVPGAKLFSTFTCKGFRRVVAVPVPPAAD